VTASFDCIFNVLDLSDNDLRHHAQPLAEAYNIDICEFVDELLLFRSIVRVKKLKFKSFDQMAKFILLKTNEKTMKHLRFLTGVILVLPFVTADCERLFSKLGYIKSADRNRLGNILNDLLLLYDSTPKEKDSIDINLTVIMSYHHITVMILLIDNWMVNLFAFSCTLNSNAFHLNLMYS